MGEAEKLRRRYVDGLRREGAITRADVAEAFATVPREVFVANGFHGRGGGWVAAGDEGFLETVYANDVLVTKIADGVPVSSSSQPSLMAAMLEALDLAPGMRVLEVGAGTGYNAALMAAIGARVTSIDVQPDVLARARTAVAGAGVTTVDLREGDGYDGYEGGAPYQRVIVTVGVAGASPRWLDQLAEDGFVLAPVRHAGNHPVLRVCRGPDGGVRAEAVCPAGFMSAAGPLSAAYPGAHPVPAASLPPPTVTRPARIDPPLDVFRYYDLSFAVGAWDRRAAFARFGGGDEVPCCALLDETGEGGAGIRADGAVVATGDEAAAYADRAGALLDRWEAAGAPELGAWWAAMALDGDPERPIWVPRDWVHQAR